MKPMAIDAPKARSMELSGWGRFRKERADAYRPSRQRDLDRILQQPLPDGVIPRGLGRSYGDSATLAEGAVVLCERLDRFLALDETAGLLTCEAGVSFAQILDLIVPRGFFLPVTPGTRFVTLGGSIAADVHGKNHHGDGSIGNFVQSLELLTGAGERLRCSREENAEVFWATVGGMGLTGFILEATIRLIPIETAYLRVRHRRTAGLGETLDRFLDGSDERKYSVAWIDCVARGSSLGRAVMIDGEHAGTGEIDARAAARPRAVPRRRASRIPFDFPDCALNPLSVRAFNQLYYATHPTREAFTEPFDTFFYPLDRVAAWNRIYGRRGFVQYQALLPPETSREGIRELLEAIVGSQRASFLAVLKRTGAANAGLLSFCRPGITLALDIPNTGEALRRLLSRLDAITLRHGGRIYLAKDALVDAETFAAMYPRLPEFREICQRLDPERRMVSSQAKRLRLR